MPRQSNCYGIMHAGVDWITATATDQRVMDRLWATMHGMQQGLAERGHIRSAWRWRGYEGSSCGGTTVGVRADSVFAQATGATASWAWLPMVGQPVNVTRLDVQVTVQDVPPQVDLADIEWQRMEAHSGKLGRQRTRARYLTRPCGSTLYIGSPKSEVRIRLYDKAAESKGEYPVGTWRYEVQARDGVAGAVAAGLAASNGDPLACVATVYEHCRTRGLQPRFQPASGGVLGVVPRTRTDAERTLRWLREQVRPAVERLVRDGYATDVSEAVGLVLAAGGD